MRDIKFITKRNFSYAWKKFAKKEVERKWHKDSFSYTGLIPSEVFTGINKTGLDVGCGSGSDMINLSKYGSRIIGIDISDSIRATFDNISKYKRLWVTQADIYNLPFKDETFDFIYTFGVLHHLPDPEKGLGVLCKKLKKGGFLIIYVYEDFSERHFLERITLKIVNSARAVTVKMPPPFLYALSIILAPFVFLSCCLPYQLLVKFPKTKGLAERLPFRHTVRLDCIASDLYDRFSPPIEFRYSRKTIFEWLKREHLEDVQVLNYRGWVAWGKKK